MNPKKVITPLLTPILGIQQVFWNLLKKHIFKEEWLPVVDESGTVHGKVALSVSQDENIYLHPIIRIALIHKGMLYLQQKPSFMRKIRQLDYPFKRYLRFKETLEEGVKQTFLQNGGQEDLPAHFIFRYVYKETNRLVYLYACNLMDEQAVEQIHLGEGKWWTGKQIEENLGTGLFSPYFEKEYDLLNATVLMADRWMHDLA
jgi:hypothetical protein